MAIVTVAVMFSALIITLLVVIVRCAGEIETLKCQLRNYEWENRRMSNSVDRWKMAYDDLCKRIDAPRSHRRKS